MTKELVQRPAEFDPVFKCNICDEIVIFRNDLAPEDNNYENQGFRVDGLDDAYHYNCIQEQNGQPKVYVSP